MVLLSTNSSAVARVCIRRQYFPVMRLRGPSPHENSSAFCHRDASRSALIDSRHSCAPSIRGADSKVINERAASVTVRHRSGPRHKSERASEAIDSPSVMCQIPATPLPFLFLRLDTGTLLPCAPPASLHSAAVLAPTLLNRWETIMEVRPSASSVPTAVSLTFQC